MVSQITPAILKLPFLLPEAYGAVNDGSAGASTELSSFMQDCRDQNKTGFMYGQYRLDNSISIDLNGNYPGDHVSFRGSGQNMRGIHVNNATGGFLFNGTGVARQHTVELRDLQFEPILADSGYPFKITGQAGGLSTQSAAIIDGVYIGARSEIGTGDFNEGPSITGVYRPRISDLRIVQPTTAANKWPTALDISNTYFPVINDLWINVAMNLDNDSGGSTIGLKWHGGVEEGGFFSNCVVNGADTGVSIERTGREPHFQWFGGHINSREIGMRINGLKYAIIQGALMYSDYVPAGVNHVDFLVEDAEGVMFKDCQFRMSGNDKRHWVLEPKTGKTDALVRNIVIHINRTDLFASSTVPPIYCNGATKVTVVIPDEAGDTDFASYPEKLVEMGPNQVASEVQIITESGFKSFDNGSAAGPDFVLDRVSSSPASSDFLGRVLFDGRNSADESTNYGAITGRILTTTNGSESGYIDFNTIENGTSQIAVRALPPNPGQTAFVVRTNRAGTLSLDRVTHHNVTLDLAAGGTVTGDVLMVGATVTPP